MQNKKTDKKIGISVRQHHVRFSLHILSVLLIRIVVVCKNNKIFEIKLHYFVINVFFENT